MALNQLLRSYCPLHYACGEGHIEVAEFLLKSGGASASKRNVDGLTPLMCAVQQGHLPIIKVRRRRAAPDPTERMRAAAGIRPR